MGYSITVKGKAYDMANKTIEMAKRIKSFGKLQKLIEFEADNDPEKVEELVNDQYKFACEALGKAAVDEILGASIDEIDVDEVLDLSITILEGYQSKAMQKRRAREEKELEKLVNNPAINKALNTASRVAELQK